MSDDGLIAKTATELVGLLRTGEVLAFRRSGHPQPPCRPFLKGPHLEAPAPRGFFLLVRSAA